MQHIVERSFGALFGIVNARGLSSLLRSYVDFNMSGGGHDAF